MTPKQLFITVNNHILEIQYRVLRGENGVYYEGICDGRPFTISHEMATLRFRGEIPDAGHQKQIISAIFDNEERVSPDNEKN